MTINVSKDVEITINAAVQSGRYASADEMIAKLVREEAQRAHQPASPSSEVLAGQGADLAREPVWERILKRTAAIPDEEFAKLPTDLAEQHDHYLYGTPKRPTQ